MTMVAEEASRRTDYCWEMASRSVSSSLTNPSASSWRKLPMYVIANFTDCCHDTPHPHVPPWALLCSHRNIVDSLAAWTHLLELLTVIYCDNASVVGNSRSTGSPSSPHGRGASQGGLEKDIDVQTFTSFVLLAPGLRRWTDLFSGV
jgi:hypothetical protein